jgi:predicted RNA-binding Zn-ribbon protein involved in translation (DUF1610 family)
MTIDEKIALVLKIASEQFDTATIYVCPDCGDWMAADMTMFEHARQHRREATQPPKLRLVE